MNREMRQTRSVPIQFRADDENAPYIEGYFSVFGDVYELWPGATEEVAPTAFDGALHDDIRALVDHRTEMVLGRTTNGTLELRVDEHGLWGRIKINPADGDAMNLYERVKRGDVDQCSFGFEIIDEETQNRDDGSVHWIIKRVKLYEVSVCTFPAYEATSVIARKRDFAEIKRRQAEVWREKMKRRIKNGPETADES